jgi:hypothetical protein
LKPFEIREADEHDGSATTDGAASGRRDLMDERAVKPGVLSFANFPLQVLLQLDSAKPVPIRMTPAARNCETA